jgi:hypothetical protein
MIYIVVVVLTLQSFYLWGVLKAQGFFYIALISSILRPLVFSY